jgi:hypothetical protein
MPRISSRVGGAVLLICTALGHCTAFLVPHAPVSSFAASWASRVPARPTPQVRVGAVCGARGTRTRTGGKWGMSAQLETQLTQTDDYLDINQVDF